MTLRMFAPVAAVVMTVVAFSASMAEPGACANFQILSVRSESGQLVVEAEHFKSESDCSFAYYETYVFQGREELKRPRVVGLLGELYLSDGSLAPTKLNGDGELEYYLPPDKAWLREDAPSLGQYSVLSVIQRTHERRAGQNWPYGQSRQTLPPMNASADDLASADTLAARFTALEGQAYTKTTDIVLWGGQ